jgi:hypothetical protein
MKIRFYVMLLVTAAVAGCTTTRSTDTQRTALEQMLISNAADQALNKVDFSPLDGRSVFVSDKYLDAVDKNYVLGTVRHKVLAAGATIAEKADDAQVIVEVRSGALGTDRTEGFIGIPQIAMPLPLPVQFPELKLFARKTQIGTAKIGLVAYDAKTKETIGTGALAMARADDSNWYIFGIGPYNSGSVRDELVTGTGQGTFDSVKKLAWYETPKPIPMIPAFEPATQADSPQVAENTPYSVTPPPLNAGPGPNSVPWPPPGPQNFESQPAPWQQPNPGTINWPPPPDSWQR